MLVLSRKPVEKVVIGNSITLTVIEVEGKPRLAFEARIRSVSSEASLPAGKMNRLTP
jgi:sRNA-binding carbon storage regulator CsrA